MSSHEVDRLSLIRPLSMWLVPEDENFLDHNRVFRDSRPDSHFIFKISFLSVYRYIDFQDRILPEDVIRAKNYSIKRTYVIDGE